MESAPVERVRAGSALRVVLRGASGGMASADWEAWRMVAKGDTRGGLSTPPAPPECWDGLRGASAAAAEVDGVSASGAAASPFVVNGEPGRGWLVALKSSRTLTEAQQVPTRSLLWEEHHARLATGKAW